jgi:LEA14-like dessication related protein
MENKTKKRLIIGTLIGSLILGGFILANQLKKIKKYSIKFNGLKFKELTAKKIIFDANFDFKNNSDLTINIKNQEYDIYINNIFITRIKSDVEQTILPETVSPLLVTIDLDTPLVLNRLKTLGDGSISSLLKIVSTFKEQDLKIVYKFGIKFGFLTIPIKFSYNDKIKNWS